jgi:hypothetical protein
LPGASGARGRRRVGGPTALAEGRDAYPGETFHGVVDTVSPATGARFSMIPPDNATGNFVKVVQRVPVKFEALNVAAVRLPSGVDHVRPSSGHPG